MMQSADASKTREDKLTTSYARAKAAMEMFVTSQQWTGMGPKKIDAVDEEFEKYAVAVEREIHSERQLTEMRLNYLQQLQQTINQDKTDSIAVAELELPKAEDTTNSDLAIMLSAIQDGNLHLIKQFLKDLKPSRRQEVLKSKICAKGGMSFLQIALENNNYEIFQELRFNMDKEMKKEVAEMKDENGNNLLHIACSNNDLISVQSVLANYKKDERQNLIMLPSNNGDNCLKMAATNPHLEVFLFLLKQFKNDELLWQCMRNVNSLGLTVAHTIVTLSSRESNKMLEALIHVAIRVNKIDEFLFQYGCVATLLHYLVTASMVDYEDEGNVLTNLTLLLTTANLTQSRHKLLWMRQAEDPKYGLQPTALYRLSSIKDQNQTRICKHLLEQMKEQDRVDYIMATEPTTGQNALHAAAKSDNVDLLQCMIRHIPSQAQMKCLMVGAKYGHTPLHIAAGDSVSVLAFKEILCHLSADERKRLVLSEESHGNTPILIAFIEGNIALVNMLMREDWMPRRMIFPLMCARNNAGWTVIHLSCMRLVGDSLTDSVLKFFSGFPGVNLKALMTHADFNGNTVLHFAALLYRPGVVTSVMKYLHISEHRRLLTKKNNDGLVASQLCNMNDLVVVKYLQPLTAVGWPEGALMAKRDGGIYKSRTQRELKKFEEKYHIKPTVIDTDAEETDLDDLQWLAM